MLESKLKKLSYKKASSGLSTLLCLFVPSKSKSGPTVISPQYTVCISAYVDPVTLRLWVTVCYCACAVCACGLQSTLKCVRDFGVNFLSLKQDLTVH